jgi:2-hydroxy-6-oxonona-2,4-dienedioate hydrolase
MVSRRTLIALGLAASAGSVAVRTAYRADLDKARQRIAAGSMLMQSRFGALEYAAAGTGPPVLMVHGTGGGFDQGLAFAARLSANGFRVIAPSRFGYLRSQFPDDASSENQADAFADLLDELRIEQIPVIGGSAGALSAIQFAIRHPKRCAALVPIVPAAYAPDRSGQPPLSPLSLAIIEHALKSDFLFWLGLKIAPDAMTSALLATDPILVEHASAPERVRVHEILWNILPVSARSRGLLNDAKLTLDPAPMALNQIAIPALTISLDDDRFGTMAAAKHIAEHVAGARLVRYPSGGHVWVGHDAELFTEVASFLRAHSKA